MRNADPRRIPNGSPGIDADEAVVEATGTTVRGGSVFSYTGFGPITGRPCPCPGYGGRGGHAVIASLLDIAGAVSGSYGNSNEIVSVTVNLNINFMSPHQGSTVTVEGELIRETRTLFFSQSRLFDPDNNRLCAMATGTFKRQERSSAVPVG